MCRLSNGSGAKRRVAEDRNLQESLSDLILASGSSSSFPRDFLKPRRHKILRKMRKQCPPLKKFVMKIEFIKSLLCGLILSMAVEVIFLIKRAWEGRMKQGKE